MTGVWLTGQGNGGRGVNAILAENVQTGSIAHLCPQARENAAKPEGYF